MNFSIFDDSGNVIDAYHDREAALDALASMVRADPASAVEYFVLEAGDGGVFTGEPVYGSSLVARV